MGEENLVALEEAFDVCLRNVSSLNEFVSIFRNAAEKHSELLEKQDSAVQEMKEKLSEVFERGNEIKEQMERIEVNNVALRKRVETVCSFLVDEQAHLSRQEVSFRKEMQACEDQMVRLEKEKRRLQERWESLRRKADEQVRASQKLTPTSLPLVLSDVKKNQDLISCVKQKHVMVESDLQRYGG